MYKPSQYGVAIDFKMDESFKRAFYITYDMNQCVPLFTRKFQRNCDGNLGIHTSCKSSVCVIVEICVYVCVGGCECVCRACWCVCVNGEGAPSRCPGPLPIVLYTYTHTHTHSHTHTHQSTPGGAREGMCVPRCT